MLIRGNQVRLPCMVETKLDGEFQYLVKRNGKTYLINKQEHGRVREGMPFFSDKIPDDSIFLGELIYGDGKDFYGFLRHKLHDMLNLAIFYCIRYNGEDIWRDKTYAEIRALLEGQEFYNERMFLVPTYFVHNESEANDVFNRIVKDGYEGVVYKSLDSHFVNGVTRAWTKRKAKLDNDLVICGFQTGTRRAKELSLLIGYRWGNKVIPLTHCASGLSIEEKATVRKVLQKNVIGKSGQDLLVKPKIVVTVEHNGPIYDGEGRLHSLRHPRFKTFRFDKTVEQADTLEQEK